MMESRPNRTHCLLITIICAILCFETLNRSLTAVKSIRHDVSSSKTNSNDNFTIWIEQEHEKRQVKIAKSKEIIPTWMAKYLVWHKEQREKLSQSHNNNTAGVEEDDIKFIVVRCLEGEVCGGLSDRLKALPFYVMVANLTNRVLLIHWKKPCELEHFMVPPVNGLDWRIEGTGVTIENIRNNSNFVDGHAGSLSSEVRKWMGASPGRETIVSSKVLNILLDGGQRLWEGWELYNRWRKEPGQRGRGPFAFLGWNTNASINDYDLYADVFAIVFQPSPEVQKEMYYKMSQLGIVGSEFNAAQVRAKYPKSIPDDVAIEWTQHQNPGIVLNAYQLSQEKLKMDMTEKFQFRDKMKSFFVKLYSNAIACADQLAPGIPIYLASDSEFAKYMKNVSDFPVRVPQLGKEADPLHIDADKNQGRAPSDFYQAFVDIFIMAKAKCLSYGAGSFGKFSIMISGNSCESQHTKTVCFDSRNSTR